MNKIVGGMFGFHDRVQMESLGQRLRRSHVLNSNIANAETPGFRALGYSFEEQLQTVADSQDGMRMKTSDPRHFVHENADADGTIRPDVFVRPSESVSEDGNSVDLDKEMANLAENEILYQSAIESINRKIGMLRYAINGGR